MPEYRIKETGEIITDLVRAFPNVSIPVPPKPDDLDALGVDPVLEGPQPSVTRFQSVYRDGVEQIDGQWFTKYAVADWDEAAIAAATEAQWEAVRQERNRKLADSDWTQLPDAPADAGAWAAYRQSLRDITSQSDPFDIAWPQEPLQ